MRYHDRQVRNTNRRVRPREEFSHPPDSQSVFSQRPPFSDPTDDKSYEVRENDELGTASLLPGVVPVDLSRGSNPDLIRELENRILELEILGGDHGGLTGLGDDDHLQYHTDARGDARYYTKSEYIDESDGVSDAGKPISLNDVGEVDATMIPSGVGGSDSFVTWDCTTGGSGTSPVADNATDTIQLFSGTGVTVTGDSSSDRVTWDMDIDGLTSESTVDTANDFVAMYDATAAAIRKVTVSDLTGGATSAPFTDSTSIAEGSADATKEVRFECDTNVSPGNVRVITVADQNIDLTPNSGDYASSANTLTAEEGLTGGGDLSDNRSFALDFSDLSTTDTSAGPSDLLSIHDGAQKKITFANVEAALTIANMSDASSFAQNSFETVDCPSGTDPVAGSATDTLTLTSANSILSITGDSGTDTIDFAVDETSIDHDQLTNFVGNEHIDHSTVEIATAAGSGLTGGGDLTTTRNLSMDIDGLTTVSIAPADTIPFHLSGSGPRKTSFSSLEGNLTIANMNDAADFVTLTGVQTLTNKTLTTPTIGSFSNANHDHESVAGGGQLDLGAAVNGTLSIVNGGTSNTTAAAAFTALSPLTTKGDILSYTTSDDRLAVGTNDGMKLVVDSGESAGIKWKEDYVSGLVKIPYPNTDHEIEIGYFPEAVDIIEMFAIIDTGTSVTFSLFDRARTAPFSGGTTMETGVTADTGGDTHDATGWTSNSLAANDMMVMDITAVSGEPTEMVVVWYGYKS